MPLPRDYLMGIDSQKWEGEVGFLDLQAGRLVRGGHWYSPFIIMARKLPLGTLLLLLATGLICLTDLRRPRIAIGLIGLTILSLLGLLSSNVGLNWVVRYAIVAFPLLFLATGRFVQVGWRSLAVRLFIVVCLALNTASLIRVRPFYFSYGNELVGGPAGGQRLFHGSNYDWGQDLLRLKAWCDRHPDIRPIALSYYGVVNPRTVGLQLKGLPMNFRRAPEGVPPSPRTESDESFYWAISSNVLHGLPGILHFEDGSMPLWIVDSPLLKPENAIARIGYSIYIFRITPRAGQAPGGKSIGMDRLAGCANKPDVYNFYTSP